VGGGVAHAVGGELRDRITVAIEFATRNVAVATTLAVTWLGRVDLAAFATAYFLTEVPLMVGVVVLFRSRLTRGVAAAGSERSVQA
jgi:ACR3 family arsenite efflux pump ArsB